MSAKQMRAWCKKKGMKSEEIEEFLKGYTDDDDLDDDDDMEKSLEATEDALIKALERLHTADVPGAPHIDEDAEQLETLQKSLDAAMSHSEAMSELSKSVLDQTRDHAKWQETQIAQLQSGQRTLSKGVKTLLKQNQELRKSLSDPLAPRGVVAGNVAVTPHPGDNVGGGADGGSSAPFNRMDVIKKAKTEFNSLRKSDDSNDRDRRHALGQFIAFTDAGASDEMVKGYAANFGLCG